MQIGDGILDPGKIGALLRSVRRLRQKLIGQCKGRHLFQLYLQLFRRLRDGVARFQPLAQIMRDVSSADGNQFALLSRFDRLDNFRLCFFQCQRSRLIDRSLMQDLESVRDLDWFADWFFIG